MMLAVRDGWCLPMMEDITPQYMENSWRFSAKQSRRQFPLIGQPTMQLTCSLATTCQMSRFTIYLSLSWGCLRLSSRQIQPMGLFTKYHPRWRHWSSMQTDRWRTNTLFWQSSAEQGDCEELVSPTCYLRNAWLCVCGQDISEDGSLRCL